MTDVKLNHKFQKTSRRYRNDWYLSRDYCFEMYQVNNNIANQTGLVSEEYYKTISSSYKNVINYCYASN